MNKKKLKQAEAEFLKQYPAGFHHPDLVAIGKKHKMEQMVELAKKEFARARFKDDLAIAEAMIKVVSRSSMVSVFEKPRFRDVVRGMMATERSLLVLGLKQWLHGKPQRGLEGLVDVLKPHKLAKWSLVSIIPNYFRPDDEVFIKPTTVKGVIECFELKGLQYKPQPSWSFYENYRDAFLTMKSLVDPVLSPSNAAFAGFLMMSMKIYSV